MVNKKLAFVIALLVMLSSNSTYASNIYDGYNTLLDLEMKADLGDPYAAEKASLMRGLYNKDLYIFRAYNETPVPYSEQKIKGTYLKVFVDGLQVPTFTHSKEHGAWIIVEDLNNYGFDVSYDDNTKTVTVVRDIKNKKKDLTPFDMKAYDHIKSGDVVFDVINQDIKVKFKLMNGTRKKDLYGNEYETYNAEREIEAYNCGGYTAIAAENLEFFGECLWDSNTQSVNIKTW